MELSKVRTVLKEVDRETFEKLMDEFDEELIYQYCYEGHSLGDMLEAYQGKYNNDAEFAEQFALEVGAINDDLHWPFDSVDWKSAASDLMMDYVEVNGHYFRVF